MALTFVVSATLTKNSGGVRLAPIDILVFRKCMVDSKEDRAVPWYSFAPVSSKILARFRSLIPPPDEQKKKKKIFLFNFFPLSM